MGHVRIGRLPKTFRWKRVVKFLQTAPDDVATIAGATQYAAHARLKVLGGDPSLGYCFWLLTRLASGASEADYVAALDRVGIGEPYSNTALGFVSELNDHVRDVVRRHPEAGPFGDFASLAFRRTLLESVGQQGQSLFGQSFDDVHHAFRAHSTPDSFGDMARRFFADYTARTLRYCVERELSNVVGSGGALATIDDSTRFSEALDVYSRQSARIMQVYARDWYSKHNFETGNQISRDEAQAFVAIAMGKLRSELARPSRWPRRAR